MEQEPNKEIIKESSLGYYFDQDLETNLFFYNIFKNKRKSHQDLIFKSFPELAVIRANQENLSEREIKQKINKVITGFRGQYADNIKQAKANIMSELPAIDEGIKSLENLMGETEHFEYKIMPSVYPVCPFNVKLQLFYFSITGVANDQTKFDRLSSTAPHEISHFIFFRQIENIPNNLSDIGIHHLKEVLTPVLLQHPAMLKYRKGNFVCGNDESIKYQVDFNGKVMSIYDYVNQEYQKNPTPEGYMPFLHWLVRLFEQIEPEVIKRDDFFNKNGRETFTDPKLKKEFTKPIKL